MNSKMFPAAACSSSCDSRVSTLPAPPLLPPVACSATAKASLT